MPGLLVSVKVGGAVALGLMDPRRLAVSLVRTNTRLRVLPRKGEPGDVELVARVMTGVDGQAVLLDVHGYKHSIRSVVGHEAERLRTVMPIAG